MVAGITVFASEWVGIVPHIPHTRILNQCLDTRFPAVLCQRESVMSCVGAANFHDNCLVLPPVAAVAVPVGREAVRPTGRSAPCGSGIVEVADERKEGRKEGWKPWRLERRGALWNWLTNAIPEVPKNRLCVISCLH